ncbi:hypothetical protein AJ78_03878 [Emergomyces pasteurianus Ep9510]|uniref:Geranylgeranyl pyrophosphate synthetase n=1 Tax=Emergomyces pasteurianus Ep9510 TaxID=1447872 RepID=A0A1J9Q6N9_9EURO|nr:hypothetical protein AJ78_03878 [Emergomyces pasteurianus Ep9510]
MADPNTNFNWDAALNRRKLGVTSAVRETAIPRQPGKAFQQRGGWKTGGRGRHIQRYVKRNEPPLDRPTGALIASIAVDTSTDAKNTSPRITGSELVGSYNWQDRDSSKILVPGAPPKWTPLHGRVQLKEDAGDYFREPNAARWPKYPMEPAIRAIFHRNPKFEGKAISIVTCAGIMGCLFKFASSAAWDFQCFAHLVGDTVFLVRKERTPNELIQGVYGYGHTFPEAYTSWDKSVKGSSTNQRIIRYQFGRFTFLVRFEADGCLGSMMAPKAQVHKEKLPSNQKGASDLDILTREAESITIDKTIARETESLQVQHAGYDVPQSAIFDLKTRVSRKHIKMDEILPRLWVRQIPNFVVAYHDDGAFDPDHIQVKAVKQDVDSWEMENETVLLRLVKVFESLVKVVKGSKKKNLLVHRSKEGLLEVWDTKDSCRSALPAALTAKWKGYDEDVDSNDDDDDDYLLF